MRLTQAGEVSGSVGTWYGLGHTEAMAAVESWAHFLLPWWSLVDSRRVESGTSGSGAERVRRAHLPCGVGCEDEEGLGDDSCVLASYDDAADAVSSAARSDAEAVWTREAAQQQLSSALCPLSSALCPALCRPQLLTFTCTCSIVTPAAVRSLVHHSLSSQVWCETCYATSPLSRIVGSSACGPSAVLAPPLSS